MHPFLPLLIIGGTALILGKKPKRKTIKALPQPEARGTIFAGDSPDRPDGITGEIGKNFSISFTVDTLSPCEWKLKATPPDNSIEHVLTSRDQFESGVRDVYIFKGVKAGEGSIVFHCQHPMLEGKAPPEDVVEFLTKIS